MLANQTAGGLVQLLWAVSDDARQVKAPTGHQVSDTQSELKCVVSAVRIKGARQLLKVGLPIVLDAPIGGAYGGVTP